MSKEIFKEQQRFNQKWMLVIILLFLAINLWGFIQQILFGVPFGNNPASDEVMVLITIVAVIIFVFMLSLKLKTRVDRHGISYRFSIVHRKERFIKWDSVQRAYVRKYKPIKEYGGWGFRLGRSGTAFNTSGNMGLQLELTDGKKLLLGTQKPEELEMVLFKLGKNNPSD
jgi:hypothetical protein